MKRIVTTIAVGLLIFIQPAYGISFRSESLEWKVNVCDIVAVAEVTSTTEIALRDEATKSDPSLQYWRSQKLTCTISRTANGKPRDSFTFRQNYWRDQREPAFNDRPLRPKDKLLLFGVEKPLYNDTNVIFWVNLTRPDVVQSEHAAYSNKCQWLGDADTIIRTVQARIDAEKKGAKAKQRGLIVDFTAAPHLDLHWDFVRTADPECKPDLINRLHNPEYPDDQVEAMYDLISYPGHETIKLILPFLRDPRTKKIQVESDADPAGKSTLKTVEVFPLRQAAYTALNFLGASPQKPLGFYPKWSFSLSTTGFENRYHFPYGEWQRSMPAESK
ncbi:MAG TPA: hypothetical protein VFG04_24175 [Planctomycetaceae bacterium]|jgi:hypothetical protein|nr:hypothetical protein [Planctomycetaceae bacterium]